MNLKRIISGLVGFPIAALIFILGNLYIMDVICAIFAIISMYEFMHCFKSTKKANPISWIAYVACVPIAFMHFIKSEYIAYIIGISVPLVILVLFMHTIISELKINIIDIAVTIFGISYVALFYAFVGLLYGLDKGKFYIWYVVFIAWGTDVCAYFIGKHFGKHKFSKVSPNKSIEGCIAGTLGAVVLSLGYTFGLNMFTDVHINYLLVLPIAAILSLVGQIGDFSASSIKRYAGIKDYSNLIPGHGGLLDRFDSFIFIAPFAYFLLMLI